jgi:hypothetical protein
MSPRTAEAATCHSWSFRPPVLQHLVDEHLHGSLHRCNDGRMVACYCRQVSPLRALWRLLLICALAVNSTSLAADYKPEFKMSLVVNQENSWGQAAKRFADAVRYRTQGRIQIRNYFDGQLFAGQQTTEFALLQQGIADSPSIRRSIGLRRSKS